MLFKDFFIYLWTELTPVKSEIFIDKNSQNRLFNI
jgi:hypothetical protein